MTEHRILDESWEGDEELLKTTHKDVMYDWLTEEFVLFTVGGSRVTVYGKDRFKTAIAIADYLNKAKEDD